MAKARKVRLTHDEALARLFAVRKHVSVRQAADAWVASLGSAPLIYRSALRSALVARWLPDHPFTPTAVYSHCTKCGVCGYDKSSGAIDLDHLDELRQRNGRGVWGWDEPPDMVALDLEHFCTLPTRVPTADDARTLRTLIRAIVALGAAGTRAKAEKCVAGVLRARRAPSNVDIRTSLLQTLSWGSVLCTADHPGVLRAFVPWDDRPMKSEWGWPLGYWSGADGVNQRALKVIFPTVFRR